MNNRDKFEQWARSKKLDLKHYRYNPLFKNEFSYENVETQMFWECWQVAKNE